MLEYDWPGNVRELQNSIERMVALNTGPWLHVADLPSALQNQRAAEPAVGFRGGCGFGDRAAALAAHAAAASLDCFCPPWKRRPS